MTNRPARPLPHLPRQTAQLAQAPHLPVPGGAAPPCRRRSLNSTPQRRFTPRRRPPPARVSFIGGAAPRSRLSTPRSRTLAPATPLSSSRSARRRTLLPTGSPLPGAAPSSQRGAPSFGRPTLLPTGLRPLPKRFSSPGRDPFCSAIPPVADPGTGAARGRLLANPCVSPHSTRHRSVLPSLFHETDPSSHRRRSSSACLRIR